MLKTAIATICGTPCCVVSTAEYENGQEGKEGGMVTLPLATAVPGAPPVPPATPSAPLSSDWEQHQDALNGKNYLSHKVTGETKWI